jgi:hypothetical protein
MNMNTPPDDGWPNQPTESDVFAASDPFSGGTFVSSDGPLSAGSFGGGEQPFGGVDAFAPGGPVPMFGVTPTAPSVPHASCIEVHRSLTFYLDGELAFEQEQVVSEHLSICPPCQGAQAFQMQLRTVVATKAIGPIPDDARARIIRALGFE